MEHSIHQHDKAEHMDHEHMHHEHAHGGMKHDHHDMTNMGSEHHEMMIKDFQKRFFVTLVLTFPVLLLSPMIQHWMGFEIHLLYSKYLLLGLSTIIFLYGGWPFLMGWLQEMKTRNPGMMTLIGFAITVAYVYSTATVFGLRGMDFFWELATLILIMLLGHWIEMRSIAGASNNLKSLIALMPATAHVLHGDHEMDMPITQLQPGMQILVKPGEQFAADGTIAQGSTSVNESMLTGESKPVQKQVNDKVIAGSINGTGAVHVHVTHAAADSYLSRVVKLVQDAQQSKSKTQLLADKAARWLTLIAIVAGIITFVAWYASGYDLAFAIERMVTVIVICCPHALGLAIPLVVARSTSLAAKNGLLIKNRTAFEDARKITTLVFDKTGTLTVGKFEVNRVESISNQFDTQQLLSYAAALEAGSEHPIAGGITEKAKNDKLTIPSAQDVQALPGKGIQGKIDGQTFGVISPNYAATFQSPLPASTQAGETLVYVLAGQQLVGYIGLSDTIRPESKGAIQTLHEQHIKTVLLTGDNKTVAESVSKEIGIDQYYAEVLPHEKLEKIKEIQQQNEFVAMTGDGVNDAPALAQANIGIAVGSGSDVAAETADIILVNSNPADVVNLVLFGKATYRKMMQNLAWATGYNLVTMPLAAGILYNQGFLLSPAAGAALMSLSTLIVAFNAGLLRLQPTGK
ncbi:Cu2+-exporting ATPase [Chitinophaga skermanii]|uniref:Cu2+-exporting ATPase n=1 Tax=Chitinophaga skermanii TaxID=331697 RepID=A0A327QXR2_9BACT|nr:copper-translocating P-type ATPase [Chitinophaga skermanii]RAJ08432.1 Cu2+-exporting ATPase [Chitinophaga skermanii]